MLKVSLSLSQLYMRCINGKKTTTTKHTIQQKETSAPICETGHQMEFTRNQPRKYHVVNTMYLLPARPHACCFTCIISSNQS